MMTDTFPDGVLDLERPERSATRTWFLLSRLRELAYPHLFVAGGASAFWRSSRFKLDPVRSPTLGSPGLEVPEESPDEHPGKVIIATTSPRASIRLIHSPRYLTLFMILSDSGISRQNSTQPFSPV